MTELGSINLKKYDFFKNLSDTVLSSLASEIEEITLKPEEVLFKKGDPGDSLYVIRTGWVKLVSIDADGSEVVLNQVGAGNMLGEMAMIDQETRSAGVVALTDTKLLKLHSKNFLDLLKKEPEMGLQVIRDISERLRFANTYLENAIEWSQRIARGDYGFATEQMEKTQATIVLSQQGDDERSNRFLATFFHMVEDIRQREEALQTELDQLIIKIDENSRKKDVKELSGSKYFKNLLSKGKKVRKNNPKEEN